MILRAVFIVFAAALLAAACVKPPEPTPEGREQKLDRAFALVSKDPGEAALIFEAVGSGTVLEQARMDKWAACLHKINADSLAWQRYLDAKPPENLTHRGRLALIQALIQEGNIKSARRERSLLPVGFHPRADELLLNANDPEIQQEAARFLVVTGPQRLRAKRPDLERGLLVGLDPEERLARSRAWRQASRPAHAAAELRTLRWRGDAEIERRRELARAEIEAGSPLRALQLLPSGRNAGTEDQVLRAEAYRNRAWQRVPNRAADGLFINCLTAAQRGLESASGTALLTDALVLSLECGTEAGRFSEAFDAWRKLSAQRWKDSRREWLGRRLGVNMARAGRDADQIQEISRDLPSHQRCLRYWIADIQGAGTTELERLAETKFADIYGQWAQETLGLAGSAVALLDPPVGTTAPPDSVQRLFVGGLEKDALLEWRRIRYQRSPAPNEAIAAAELAFKQGQNNEPIRWLRAAFPELGTVRMIKVPEDVVRGYLPLRWHPSLIAAASESGVDPWLIAAVARQESVFTAHARSSKGAVGLLQLIPSTARMHARALGLRGEPNLTNPALNLRLGARELAHLLNRFGEVEPALAAYNAGETRVRGWWRRWPERRRFTEAVPIPETYNYIRRVVYLAEAYRIVYADQWRNAR